MSGNGPSSPFVWMVAYLDGKVEIHKKNGAKFKAAAKKDFEFKPNSTYHMKVTTRGKTLTAYVNDEQVAEVAMNDAGAGTKFGLGDHSSEDRHPTWDNFKVESLEAK